MPMQSTGLSRDSVLNVSQLLTVDRPFLAERAGALPLRLQRAVDEGPRKVPDLSAGPNHGVRPRHSARFGFTGYQHRRSLTKSLPVADIGNE